jgi:hypothetical protein
MDPQTAIRNAIAYAVDGDWQESAEYLRNAIQWVKGGGFLPTLTPNQLLFLMNHARMHLEALADN